MKKSTVLLAFIMLLFISLSATDYTIGTGTSGTYDLPFNGFYNYNWSKVIYSKAEINTAGLTVADTIFSIGFNAITVPVNYVMTDQRIYIRHTTATVVDETYPGTAGFTEVFASDVIYSGVGWKMFDFSTPFVWNNVNNLEILFENHDGSYQINYPVFAYMNMAGYISAHMYDDFVFPNYSGSITHMRPNLRLSTGSSLPPNPALLIYPGNGSTGMQPTVNLSWASGGNIPVGYKLYFGTSPTPPLIGDLGFATSWNPPSDLAVSTTYYWKVVPYNANGNATGCPVWSFTTRNEFELYIGEGTNQVAVPIVAAVPYSYTQSVYYQSELTSPHHMIESLSYYWTGPLSTHSNNWTIYLGNVNRDLFWTPTDFVPLDSLTQVFSGNVDLPDTPGWITILLTEPFSYNPALNLLIAVDENTSSSDPSDGQFLGYMEGAARCIVGANFGSNIDPAIPVATTTNRYVLNGYSNLRIGFAQDGLQIPEVTITKTSYGIALNWPAVPGAQGYYIRYSADPYAAEFDTYSFTTGTSTSYVGPYERLFFKVTASTEMP